MLTLIIHQNKIKNISHILKLCPFNALEEIKGEVKINAACTMCKACLKKDSDGVFELLETEQKLNINIEEWRDIVVYVEHTKGKIHPVTLELINKAREMADKIDQKVKCIFIGHDIKKKAESLQYYNIDSIYIYDDPLLSNFRIEPYTAVLEDFFKNEKPNIVLLGGTNTGRSLGPRIAARFRTGLTADCTLLDVQKDGSLDQIRPAFGGNIMAHICTPNHRPQFATVRYNIFSLPKASQEKQGQIVECHIDKNKLKSNITLLKSHPKEISSNLEEAEVIVVAGRGVKKKDDLWMIHALAELLNAQIAFTRPLIEAGWSKSKTQIGLSGRTVKPKLIITCGVSGAIQFVAGMNNSHCIIAINKDKNAPIFKAAHYALLGDLYEIIPGLLGLVKEGK